MREATGDSGPTQARFITFRFADSTAGGCKPLVPRLLIYMVVTGILAIGYCTGCYSHNDTFKIVSYRGGDYLSLPYFTIQHEGVLYETRCINPAVSCTPLIENVGKTIPSAHMRFTKPDVITYCRDGFEGEGPDCVNMGKDLPTPSWAAVVVMKAEAK
jgi:hypothetical protein